MNTSDDLFCAKCGAKLRAAELPAGTSGGSAGSNSRTPEIRYVTVGLPEGLTVGMILVLLGGLLILVGFMVFVVGTASLGSSTTLDSLKTYLEEFAALAGTGFFLAPIGWALHQISLHRRRGQ